MAFEGWGLDGGCCGCKGNAVASFGLLSAGGILLPDPKLKYYEFLPADKCSFIPCPVRLCGNRFIYATNDTLKRHRLKDV